MPLADFAASSSIFIFIRWFKAAASRRSFSRCAFLCNAAAAAAPSSSSPPSPLVLFFGSSCLRIAVAVDMSHALPPWVRPMSTPIAFVCVVSRCRQVGSLATLERVAAACPCTSPLCVSDWRSATSSGIAPARATRPWRAGSEVSPHNAIAACLTKMGSQSVLRSCTRSSTPPALAMASRAPSFLPRESSARTAAALSRASGCADALSSATSGGTPPALMMAALLSEPEPSCPRASAAWVAAATLGLESSATSGSMLPALTSVGWHAGTVASSQSAPAACVCASTLAQLSI